MPAARIAAKSAFENSDAISSINDTRFGFVGENAKKCSIPGRNALGGSDFKKANTASTPKAVTKESTLEITVRGCLSLFDKLYALLRKS